MEPVPDPRDLLRHAGWLRALARSLVADAATADDLVQETWTAAVERPPAHAATARAWLGRVLRNAAAQRFRAESRRTRRERAAARHEELPSSADLTERMELQRALVEAVLALPEPHRSVIVLRYYEGLSAAEIARKRGLPGATVRSRLKRGLDELRRQLDRRHGGRREAWSALLLPWLDVKTGTAAAGATALASGVLTMSTGIKLGVAAGIAAVAVIGYQVASREPPQPKATLETPEVARAEELAVPESAPVETEVAEGPVRRELSASDVAPDGPVAEAASWTGIEAEIVDPDGNPIEGARIEVPRMAPGGRPVASGPSESDGKVHLSFDPSFVPFDHPYTLLLSCPGHVPKERKASMERGRVTCLGQVVLQPAGTVHGVVLDPNGLPVEGARVVAIEANSERFDDAVTRRMGPYRADLPETRTSADGSFQMESLAPGFARLWARSETTLWTLTDPLEVRAGQVTSHIVIRLERAEANDFVSGVVLDPDGRPVAGAQVSCTYHHDGGSSSRSSSSDGDGHFRILLAGRIPHDISAEDMSRRWNPVALSEVEPGSSVVLRFLLPGSCVIEVTDRNGNPLEGAAVRIESQEWMGGALARFTRNVRKDKEAPDILRIRVPDSPFQLDVSAPGFRPTHFGPFEPRSLGDRIVCTLEPLPGIEGRVLIDGEPVCGARVELFAGPREQHGEIEIFYLAGFYSRVSPQAEASTRTDSEGRFLLTPGEDLDYVVRAEIEGFAPAELELEDYHPDEGRDGIELRLTPGGAIEGRVVTPAGDVPAYVVVVGSRGDGKIVQTAVDADGHYRLERLIPGPWQVEVLDAGLDELTHGRMGWAESAPEPDPSCIVVEGETTALDIERVRNRIVGRLTIDRRSAATWSAELRWVAADGVQFERNRATIDAEGGFLLELRRPGTGELTLTAPPEQGGLELRAPVEVRSGASPWELDLETAPVEIENLPAGEHLYLYAEGPLETRIRLRLDRTDGSRLTVPGFPIGEIRVVCFPGGGWWPEMMETLATARNLAGQTTRIVVP